MANPSNSSEKVLFAGAEGFIGSHLVEKLIYIDGGWDTC
jgi:nucleoside-diphosphate-sugar epimerase